MALKHVYVDESLSSGGTGTSVDPYSSLALALSSEAQNASGGTQFNIKSGAAIVQATTDRLDQQISANFTPTASSPIIFRGYDSVENDGGTFDWDLNSRTGYFYDSSSVRYVTFIDGKFRDANYRITNSNLTSVHFVNLHIDNIDVGSSGPALNIGTAGSCIGCHFSNITTSYGYHLQLRNRSKCSGCYFDGTTGFGNGNIIFGANASQIQKCIFVCVDDRSGGVGWTYGFRIFTSSGQEASAAIDECTFLKLGKTTTGRAISMDATGNSGTVVRNCLFEGWNTAIRQDSSDARLLQFVGNSFFDCTTEIADPSLVISSENNETLTSSPFEKSGTLSYPNRAQYFAPADVGNVRTGGYSPHGASGVTRGAIPFAGSGGTGAAYNPHPLLG